MIRGKLRLDIFTGGRNFVVGRKGITIGAEGARHLKYFCVPQCLLHPVADSVIVVLGLHHGNGDARLP